MTICLCCSRLLQTDFASLRVDRASPASIENLTCLYEGQSTPIRAVAQVVARGPLLLSVNLLVDDKAVVESIIASIRKSNAELNPVEDKNSAAGALAVIQVGAFPFGSLSRLGNNCGLRFLPRACLLFGDVFAFQM